MGTMPPIPPDNPTPITAQQLAYVLFGNPINPQDKGIIGRMQDQVRQLVALAWAFLLTFIAATLAFAFDLILHILR